MLNESDARERWNTWTPEFKLEFIKLHQFNPRFAMYAWGMLPYSVQQLVRASDALNGSPHIVGKCSECGTVYDLTGGIECPECGWNGLEWAYHANSTEEAQHVAYTESTPPLTEQEKQGIAELERMLGL